LPAGEKSPKYFPPPQALPAGEGEGGGLPLKNFKIQDVALTPSFSPEMGGLTNF